MVIIPLSRGKVALIDKIDDIGLKWYFHGTDENGYPARRSKKEGMVYLHRWVLERKLGRPLKKGEEGEHRNGRHEDCRRVNIRPATHVQNAANAKVRSDNTSGAKGVSLDRRNGHYVTYFAIKGKKYHLGSFKTLEEAVVARKKKELEMYGEFAYEKRVSPLDELEKLNGIDT